MPDTSLQATSYGTVSQPPSGGSAIGTELGILGVNFLSALGGVGLSKLAGPGGVPYGISTLPGAPLVSATPTSNPENTIVLIISVGLLGFFVVMAYRAFKK
jgi:hypothetical protein